MSVLVAIPIRRDYWNLPPVGNGPGHRSVPDVMEAVVQAGGTPRLIYEGTAPTPEFQAMILPGGGDVHPGFYGQTPGPGVESEPSLDRFQLGWARWALRGRVPMLGICRGLQVMNVAAGGTLIQDLPGHRHSVREEAAHALELEHDSELGRLLGRSPVGVNSLHHQALDRVAAGLKVVATAPDGTVEAAVGRGPGWALGVQFHPEDLRDRPRFQRLFDRLVEAAAR